MFQSAEAMIPDVLPPQAPEGYHYLAVNAWRQGLRAKGQNAGIF